MANKRFTCKSEAQKRAIAAYYAKRAKKENVALTVPNGTVLHSYDYYFEGTDGNSRKGRYVIVLDSNSAGELGVGKVTHSKKQIGVSVEEYFDENSQVLSGGLYTFDNNGKPICVSNKFEVKFSKGVIPSSKVDEILKNMLEDVRFGKSNLDKLNQLKDKK